MQSSTYDLSGWGPTTEALPWAAGENFDDRMTRLGFHRWFTVPGDERDAMLLSLDVWGGGPAPWPIMVCVEEWAVESYDEILVASPAALWRLLGELVPVIERIATLELTVQRDGLLRRAYCAWHGHDAAAVCRACDPVEARLRAEARHRDTLRRAQSVATGDGATPSARGAGTMTFDGRGWSQRHGGSADICKSHPLRPAAPTEGRGGEEP